MAGRAIVAFMLVMRWLPERRRVAISREGVANGTFVNQRSQNAGLRFNGR
jgi:hypothetical protein